MSVYNTVGSSTNTFTNNKKTKLVAANIQDARLFSKASVSKMSQSEFAGKKYGKSYTLTITGTPKVVNGVVADPSDLTEYEVPVRLDNDNTSVELGVWQRLGDIEKFQDQVASPFALKLVRTQEKTIIANEILKAAQTVIVPLVGGASGASVEALSKAGAKLRKLAVSGEMVGFLDPDSASEITQKSLNKFNTNVETFNKLYGDAAIGRFAQINWVETPDLFEISTPASAATGSVTLTAIQDADNNTIGFEPVDTISGTNLYKGAVFTATGLKVVDCSGIQTSADYSFVVIEANAAGTSGKVVPVRITIDGKNCNNPNAWVPAGTSTLTLVSGLGTSKKYAVCSARSKGSFCFDAYRFDDLPGSENEIVSTVGGSSVKMSTYGDGTTLTKFVRLDAPYAAAQFNHRENVVIFFEIP